MLTEVIVSNIHNPTSNLHLTRKQLDDLDVLVQKMLALPDANLPAVPQKAEPDFSSMGIFSPDEAPWSPRKIEPAKSLTEAANSPIEPVTASVQMPREEIEPLTLQSILNRQPQVFPKSSPKIEEPRVETPAEATMPSEQQSGWKPSSLTWAPLAQSWEKLRQEELEKQQKEIKQQTPAREISTVLPAEIPKIIPQEIKQDPGTTKSSTPLNFSSKSEPRERKKPSKFKTLLLDAIGFVGILVFVCAAALYLSSSFDWPMK
jgi:hypothetical protein